MRAQAPASGVLDRVCDRLFGLGVCAVVAYVLWLPLMPTGDGPVHLYYADVLWSLMRRQAIYAHDYAIRHLFAPYLVHYLALTSFEHVLAPSDAEKAFVAVIFVVMACGFRSLARALGTHAGVASLWMLPLLFSWSLGGGFLNCCFATGIAFFSFAVWTRLGLARVEGRGALRVAGRLAGYALLLCLLVLSHPVPLLVLLLFTASDLLLQGVARAMGSELEWPVMLPQGVALLLTCAAFVAPVLLAQKGQAAAVLPGVGFHKDVLLELVSGMRLGLFAGLDVHTARGWLAIVARGMLVAIVPGTAGLLMLSRWTGRVKGRGWEQAARALVPRSAAGRLALIGVLYLAVTTIFPRSLNNSYFFPQRMWDIVWPLVLASASAATLGRRAQVWLASLGVALAGLIAVTGLPALASIARAQQQLAKATLPKGARGLLVEADAAEQGRGAATTYPVWFWAGARAFEASHAVLLNSPWLGLTILPVRDAEGPAGSQALLDRGLPSILSENPLALTHVLAAREAEAEPGRRAILARAILARADFLLYVDPVGGAGSSAATLAAAGALVADEQPGWRCVAPGGLYAICTRARQ